MTEDELGKEWDQILREASIKTAVAGGCTREEAEKWMREFEEFREKFYRENPWPPE